MSFETVQEMLELILSWEEDLEAFYGKAEEVLRDPRSKKIVQTLRKKQQQNLDMIKAIDVHKYDKSEFITNTPDYKSASIIPKVELDENASPDKILKQLLEYEGKLEDFYQSLRDKLIYHEAKELLDMLLGIKIIQIKEINGILESYDLAL